MTLFIVIALFLILGITIALGLLNDYERNGRE